MIDICKQCGRCCHPVIDGKLGPPCRFLVKNKDGTTSCKVYLRNRLGRFTGYKNHRCGLRKDTLYDYEGCPYNTNKPIAKD